MPFLTTGIASQFPHLVMEHATTAIPLFNDQRWQELDEQQRLPVIPVVNDRGELYIERDPELLRTTTLSATKVSQRYISAYGATVDETLPTTECLNDLLIDVLDNDGWCDWHEAEKVLPQDMVQQLLNLNHMPPVVEDPKVLERVTGYLFDALDHAIETMIVQGDTSLGGRRDIRSAWDGLLKMATPVKGGGSQFTPQEFSLVRQSLGKWGLNHDDLLIVVTDMHLGDTLEWDDVVRLHVAKPGVMPPHAVLVVNTRQFLLGILGQPVVTVHPFKFVVARDGTTEQDFSLPWYGIARQGGFVLQAKVGLDFQHVGSQEPPVRVWMAEVTHGSEE